MSLRGSSLRATALTAARLVAFFAGAFTGDFAGVLRGCLGGSLGLRGGRFRRSDARAFLAVGAHVSRRPGLGVDVWCRRRSGAGQR